MPDSSEDLAGRPHPEPPGLDQALWTAAPRPTLGEKVIGITGSVLAHLVVGGGLLAVAMLAPSRQPPGLNEIPVEFVIESSALASAEPETLDQPVHKEADFLPPANAPAASEAPVDDALTSDTEQALLPEIPQEPETAASREPTDEFVATISPGPVEQIGDLRAEPVDRPTTPFLPLPASPRPAAATSNSQQKLRPKQTTARADTGQKQAPAPEARRVARQPDQAAPRSRAGSRVARSLNQGKDAVQAARGMMPRMARVGHATSPAEQGSRAEAAASPAAAASYRSQVIAHLTRFKRYPLGAETRGAEGTPVVSFSLDGGGRVASVALARSSGHPDIDAETLAMVRRAVPFPAPPPGAPHAISAAISFQLR